MDTFGSHVRLRVVFLLALAGCSAAAGTPDLETGDPASFDCADRGCDGFTRPGPLAAIALDTIATCTSEVNLADTSFFAEDRVSCSFQIPAELGVERAYVQVGTARDPYPSPQVIEGARLRDATPIPVRQFAADSGYPAQIQISLIFDIGAEGGDIGAPASSSIARSHRFGWAQSFASRADLARATAAAPVRVALPFDLWPVAVWPSAELSSAWVGGSVSGIHLHGRSRFPVTSAPLIVGGAPAATEIDYVRERFAIQSRMPSLHPVARDLFFVPVPRGAAASAMPRIEIDFFEGEAVATTLTGPGYLVVVGTGHASLTAPDALPPIAGVTDPGPAPVPDGGVVDPGPERGADSGPPAPADPCAGSCTATQVCVAAACVDRAMQIQQTESGSTMACRPARALCDLGEDGDCADGHACVAGYCMRRACQIQWLESGSTMYCRTPYAVCDAGEDSDCGDGHLCIGGKCLRRACQIQPLDSGSSMYCRPAYAPCEGDSDDDCAPDHACVAGTCRRIACQIQPLESGSTRYCRTAYASCDAEDTDCAPGHHCLDDLCLRDACTP